MEKEMAKTDKLMEKMKEADTPNSNKRLKDLEKYSKICGEVYQCL